MTDNENALHVFSGYAFALGATAIWSGNFIVARGLNENIPPVSLAFFRWLVAVIVLFPFAIKPFIRNFAQVKQNLRYLCTVSFLGITVFNTLIYTAGHTTTAMNLSLIAITFPVFIVIFSRIFFAEPITVNKRIGIFLVVTGVILLITKGNPTMLLEISFAIGDLWMLGAAVIFAVYSILLKFKPQNMSILAFQWTTFVLGLVFLSPLFIWEQLSGPAMNVDAKTIGAILYVGVFASLGAFLLWNKAILCVGPSRAGMVYYSLPLFCGIAAFVFLGERFTMIHFYSTLAIVPGIVVANSSFGKNR